MEGERRPAVTEEARVPPDHSADVLVFVYGTLTEPDRVDALLDDWAFAGDAVLDGLHRVDGAYPTLAPGGSFEGRLLHTDEVDRLDAYEGVDRGLYVRVAVPLADDDSHDDVAVYVGDPAPLDAPVAWPGGGPIEDRVRAYADANDVVVRYADDRQD